MSRQTIRQELVAMTSDRCRFGESKFESKQRDLAALKVNPNLEKFELEARKYFFSKSTYEQYIHAAVLFCRWSNSKNGKRLPADSKELKDYIEPYLETKKEEGLSAWTLQTIRTELSKIFEVDLDYIELPKRTNSSKGRSSDSHWNPENHKDQIHFYESIGARKNEYRFLKDSEISALEKKLGKPLMRDLHGRVSNLQVHRGSDGMISSITVLKAKHGKSNRSVILPENRSFVTDVFDSGQYESFYNPADHCNVHACRRTYAQRLYFRHRRDLSSLPENELYRCRGQLKGCIYDKKALDIVAKSLGHGNDRHCDVVHRYLR